MGLEAAGFTPLVAVETNKAAVATIKANKPKLPIIDRSIREVSTREILEKAKLSPREATLVSGGPCCQAFSTAGKRKSVCDPRGRLFEDFLRVVRETQPRFFVMENVKGLLSAAIKHRPLKERGPGFPPLAPEEELGSAFRLILRELESLNYYVIYTLVNAADYGSAQIRYRVIIIGSRDGENISAPQKTHSEEGSKGTLKWVTLREALRGIKSKEWTDFSESRMRYLRMIRPGENWSSLPKRLQRKAIGGAYDSWGGRKGFCRRLSLKEPSPSLTTAPDGRATTLCHPRKDRPLSVEEYRRIQDFPPDYVFEGSVKEKYKMIGNAVPLSIGKAVGDMLQSTMEITENEGLPEDATNRKGLVVCADPELEKRLKNRPRTQLPPLSHRENRDPVAAKEWVAQIGSMSVSAEKT